MIQFLQMADAHRGIIFFQKEISPSRQGTISKRTTSYERDIAPMPSNAQENLRTSRQNYIEKNNSMRRATLPNATLRQHHQHQPQQLQQKTPCMSRTEDLPSQPPKGVQQKTSRCSKTGDQSATISIDGG